MKRMVSVPQAFPSTYLNVEASVDMHLLSATVTPDANFVLLPVKKSIKAALLP